MSLLTIIIIISACMSISFGGIALVSLLADRLEAGRKRTLGQLLEHPRLSKPYQADLANLLSYTTAAFVDATEQWQKDHKQFLNRIETEMRDQIKANRATLDETFQHTASGAEHSFNDFLDGQQIRLTGAIDRELKKSQDLILAYQNRRINMINERLVDIIEEVVRQVLHKTMGLEEQAGLVEKALQDAYRDGFFNEKESSGQES